MSSVVVKMKSGPSTYVVRSAVAGGQLVQAHIASKKVEPAAADSALVLGVALYDAAPLGTTGGFNASGAPGGNPLFDFSGLQEEVAVAFTGLVKLRATATVAWGDLLKPGAAGSVVPIGASAYGLVVAQCVDPEGIANGAWGICRLRLT
jgi:hypothetical protein